MLDAPMTSAPSSSTSTTSRGDTASSCMKTPSMMRNPHAPSSRSRYRSSRRTGGGSRVGRGLPVVCGVGGGVRGRGGGGGGMGEGGVGGVELGCGVVGGEGGGSGGGGGVGVGARRSGVVGGRLKEEEGVDVG